MISWEYNHGTLETLLNQNLYTEILNTLFGFEPRQAYHLFEETVYIGDVCCGAQQATLTD